MPIKGVGVSWKGGVEVPILLLWAWGSFRIVIAFLKND